MYFCGIFLLLFVKIFYVCVFFFSNFFFLQLGMPNIQFGCQQAYLLKTGFAFADVPVLLAGERPTPQCA